MRNLALIILLAVFACQSQAQEDGRRSLAAFTSVSASQSISTVLRKGTDPRVEVSTNGDLEDVITKVSEGDLVIEMASNKNYKGIKVEVIVYFQDLERVKASSSSRIVAEDMIEAKNFEIKGSSSSSIELIVNANNIEVKGSSSARIDLVAEAVNIDAKISSSCRLSMKGNAENVDAKVSSSGSVEASQFNCDNADLVASSSGSIELNVEEKLSAKASSSGRIRYGGKPTYVEADKSSGGRVFKM